MIFSSCKCLLRYFLSGKKTIHRNGTKLVAQGAVDLREYAMKITFGTHVRTLELVCKAVVDGDRTIDAFDDRAEADLRRGVVQLVAAGNTLVGFRNAGLRQLAQDLECEPQRYAGCLRNILCTLLFACKCQTIGHTNCIIRFMCDSQIVPSFLSLEQL